MSVKGVKVLSCQNLSLENNYNYIFKNVGFTLLPGSLLIVKGSNGSGKTCLLKMLVGLINHKPGKILWNKIDINTDLNIFQQNVCYIGHDNALKKELTVFENLSFWSQLKGVPELFLPAIHHFKLHDVLEVMTGSLSAGWQRKIELAKLLLSETNLWLLDEPEINLDNNAKNLLMDLIKVRVRERGVVIIASHAFDNLPYAHYLNIEDFKDG
jgi:heme exporter protein A